MQLRIVFFVGYSVRIRLSRRSESFDLLLALRSLYLRFYVFLLFSDLLVLVFKETLEHLLDQLLAWVVLKLLLCLGLAVLALFLLRDRRELQFFLVKQHVLLRLRPVNHCNQIAHSLPTSHDLVALGRSLGLGGGPFAH